MYLRVWIPTVIQALKILLDLRKLNNCLAARVFCKLSSSLNIPCVWLMISIQTRKYIWHYLILFFANLSQHSSLKTNLNAFCNEMKK